MMVRGTRQSDKRTKNRKTHQENMTEIAIKIAEGINKKENREIFNIKMLAMMTRHHDIGHTFFGHSGEWWLSNIGEDYGIGYYVHNSLGPRKLIYRDKIYDEIINKIKQNHPQISTKRLDRIRGSLWLIMEGINTHNGEKPDTEFRPDFSKNEKDFEEENLKCHTIKGFDRTLTPATRESCLLKLSDKMSYAPYDTIDGLREGFITSLNDEFIDIFTNIGISMEDIEYAQETGDYDRIAQKTQEIWIQDTVENSNGDVVRMSKKQGGLQKQLINENNKQIVNYVVLQEDNDTYPPALRRLMNAYGNIVLREELLDKLSHMENEPEEKKAIIEKYKGTPFQGFVEYTCETNPEDFEHTQQIVEDATRKGIAYEQEKARQIVLNGENFRISPEFRIRDTRIKNYISYYQGKDVQNYTDEQKQSDIEQIMENIKSSRKRSYTHFSPRKRVALELGRYYLATLGDFEFVQLLLDTKIIDQTQYKSLTRKYKDFDFKKEQYVQSNWIQISKVQEKAAQESNLPTMPSGGDARA